MTWFDLVAGAVIALIVWLESHRGFGRALFDLLGGIIALKLSTAVASPLGALAPVFEGARANEAFWMGAIFAVLAAAILVASKFIYETTLLSLDVLDPVVGGLFGLVSGMVVVHLILRVLLAGYGPGEASEALMRSLAAKELIEFRAYNIVTTALRNLGKW